MSAPPPLYCAAGTSRHSRSASKAVVKAASGFHVFHIDGYSLTRTIPGGEKISSPNFSVGGRRWRVDLYPNGTDSCKEESDSMALYLVYVGEQAIYRSRRAYEHHELDRLVAQYKFSLLDHAGDAAYELPAVEGVFTCSSGETRGCGHDRFISWGDLERRRQVHQLRGDCLAIRCDIGVIDQLTIRSIVVGAKRRRRFARDDTDTASSGSSSSDDTDTGSSSYSDDSCSDSDCSRSPRRHRNKRSRRRHRRRQLTLDDNEYVLRTFES